MLKKIREKNINPEKVDEIFESMLNTLKKVDPDAYMEYKMKLEKLMYTITKEDAERIVRNMKPKGQMWSYEQVKRFIENKGYEDNFVDWYLVMNMCYNDYYNTAKTYGLQNEDDFYYNLAKDFIEDPDASPIKVAKYFM